MNEFVFDGAGYIYGDMALACLITLSAIVTYARVAFEAVPNLRMPATRLVMAVGWSIWSLRFWITLANNGDVMVAPVSLVAIGMITSSYCVVQIRAIRRAIALLKNPIYCLQVPSEACQREDRVEQVMRRKDD